jgi:hypothetical protein
MDLNQLIEMSKRLREHARRLKMSYDCSVVLLGHSKAETRIEDGKPYHYPETIDFNVENWSTFKGSYRVSDGRIIREGADLNGAGMSVAQLYKRMLSQLKAHAEVIALHDEAAKVNGIVFRGKIVKAKGFEARKWFGNRNTIFTIYTRKGKSNWYGASAEDALSNASPWLKHQPTRIEVKGS